MKLRLTPKYSILLLINVLLVYKAYQKFSTKYYQQDPGELIFSNDLMSLNILMVINQMIFTKNNEFFGLWFGQFRLTEHSLKSQTKFQRM